MKAVECDLDKALHRRVRASVRASGEGAETEVGELGRSDIPANQVLVRARRDRLLDELAHAVLHHVDLLVAVERRGQLGIGVIPELVLEVRVRTEHGLELLQWLFDGVAFGDEGLEVAGDLAATAVEENGVDGRFYDILS